MERPSHIIFASQSHPLSNRMPLFALAVCVQIAILWAFTHGLSVGTIFHGPGPIDVVRIPDQKLPPVVPPEPKLEKPILPKAAAPLIPFEPGRNDHTITTQQTTVTTPGPLTAEPDRPAVGIKSTHTIPPYPPIARRLGAEGKVTLRLTVLADGEVGKAEIMSSSGRADLDETAQQWIVAHWTYKPALSDGHAAVSQTLATVTFSLKP